MLASVREAADAPRRHRLRCIQPCTGRGLGAPTTPETARPEASRDRRAGLRPWTSRADLAPDPARSWTGWPHRAGARTGYAPRGAPGAAASGTPTGRRGWPRSWSPPGEPAASREPWRHQVEAAEAAHRGEHVVVSTGTASGKSLGYLLPALTDDPGARGRGGQRGATVLYLSPTKALAQDQLAGCGPATSGCAAGRAGGHPRRRLARASSGTGPATTRSTSSPTPTCCTARCCPGTRAGRGSSALLRYVVVDECHHYRGVFGAHVAQVLRRLRRVVRAVRRDADLRARLGHGRRRRTVSPARLTGLRRARR